MKSKETHKPWYGCLAAIITLFAAMPLLAQEAPAQAGPVSAKSITVGGQKFYSINKNYKRTAINNQDTVQVQRGEDSDYIALDRNKIRITKLAGKYGARTEKSHGVVVTRPNYDTEAEIPAVNESKVPTDPIEVASTTGGNDVLSLFDPYANINASATNDKTEPSSVKIKHAWPLSSEDTQYISSTYGIRADPFTNEPAFHEGLDIAAEVGTPIYASADAVVDVAKKHRQLGNYVMLRHADGTYTRYAHLSEILVNEGDVLSAGDPLGKMGSTGRSTGSHLDYTMYIGGVAVNPLRHLRQPAGIKRLSKALD